MQAIKVVVPGLYWDSQMYSGFLYLFRLGGEITVVDWNRVVTDLPIDDALRLVKDVAFMQSNLLYSPGARRLITDPEIRAILADKFKKLASEPLSIDVAGSKPATQDNPLPFPHNDSDIHYSKLFVGTQSGLFEAKCNGRSKKPVYDAGRQWDAPVLDLSADNRAVALAAGSEGLYERKFDDSEPLQVAPKHCTMCAWTFYSIFGSSHLGSGFLASYEMVEADEHSRRRERPVRKFDRLISSDDLFSRPQDHGFSWGGHDKLYQYKDGLIDIVRYAPKAKNPHDRFKTLGRIPLQTWKGEVVSAKVAPFGMVVECDNALVVLRSDGETVTIPGAPVNWRVFPKSEHYTNQLHIIYEDRLEILSFYHDYFTGQKDKFYGMSVGAYDD